MLLTTAAHIRAQIRSLPRLHIKPSSCTAIQHRATGRARVCSASGYTLKLEAYPPPFVPRTRSPQQHLIFVRITAMWAPPLATKADIEDIQQPVIRSTETSSTEGGPCRHV